MIRLRSLGDCVLTTPALEILRQVRPDLRVGIVVEDRFREIFEDIPHVDEILPAQRSALRRFRPDLCLNLHGGTRSAGMTAVSGARWRAGFGHFRYQAIYNVPVPRAQQILGEERTVHTAEHLASAMFYLGVPVCEIPRATLSATPPGNGSSYAVIHAVAATPAKTWHPEGFLAVATYLRESGVEPVFIGAAGDDLSRFHEFRTVAGASLTEVKNLLAGAALFVGNDSGPAHMAAAFGLPMVVIFGASDPAIWGPWRTQAAVLKAHGGIRDVSTASVFEALTRLKVAA